MSRKQRIFLYRIDRTQWQSDQQILDAFEQCGAQVDAEFGFVPIDRSGQKVVLRGMSTDAINENLRIEYDVESFADVSVGPVVKK